jgi:hypothetical protein
LDLGVAALPLVEGAALPAEELSFAVVALVESGFACGVEPVEAQETARTSINETERARDFRTITSDFLSVTVILS